LANRSMPFRSAAASVPDAWREYEMKASNAATR
jgi:hypothetical protein